MPWDEVSDLVSEHLNNRLGLHFSLVSGSGGTGHRHQAGRDRGQGRAEQVSVIRFWIPSLISFLSVVRTALMELEDLDSVAEEYGC